MIGLMAVVLQEKEVLNLSTERLWLAIRFKIIRGFFCRVYTCLYLKLVPQVGTSSGVFKKQNKIYFSLVYFVRQMFYNIRHNYSNIKILARKLTRKPYGLMIVSSLLKYTVLNNLTYDLLTHNQNKYTIS